MRLYTIGYSKKTAEEFFDILRNNGVKQVVDIRRHNSNQLAGFTKQSDLPWFLDTIADIGYTHELALAPSEDLMHAYRKEGLPFDEFAKQLRAEFAELVEASRGLVAAGEAVEAPLQVSSIAR